jgi:hypothetical protein
VTYMLIRMGCIAYFDNVKFAQSPIADRPTWVEINRMSEVGEKPVCLTPTAGASPRQRLSIWQRVCCGFTGISVPVLRPARTTVGLMRCATGGDN